MTDWFLDDIVKDTQRTRWPQLFQAAIVGHSQKLKRSWVTSKCFSCRIFVRFIHGKKPADIRGSVQESFLKN